MSVELFNGWSAIVPGFIGVNDFLAFSKLVGSWRLPRSVDSCTLPLQEFLTPWIQEVTLVFECLTRMISFEHRGTVRPEVRIDIVILLGWVVVHVVHPAMPCWTDFLRRWEPMSIVRVLNEATLVFVLVIQVFVVSVSVLIRADKRRKFVTETSLLMCWTVGLTPEDSSHQTFLSVKLPELRAHHADGHTPRSHIYY